MKIMLEASVKHFKYVDNQQFIFNSLWSVKNFNIASLINPLFSDWPISIHIWLKKSVAFLFCSLSDVLLCWMSDEKHKWSGFPGLWKFIFTKLLFKDFTKWSRVYSSKLQESVFENQIHDFKSKKSGNKRLFASKFSLVRPQSHWHVSWQLTKWQPCSTTNCKYLKSFRDLWEQRLQRN